MVSRANRGKQKQRGDYQRHRKRIVAFMCEGNNKTETNYFKDLFAANSDIRAKFVPSKVTDPVKMAEDLKKYIINNTLSAEYGDKAFCLVDWDMNSAKDNKIQNAIKILRDTIGQLVLSNPNFEVWFLCHVSDNIPKFSKPQDSEKLTKKNFRFYEKNNTDMYNKIKDKTSYATKNAKILKKKLDKDETKYNGIDYQPYTGVYKILEWINMKKKK